MRDMKKTTGIDRKISQKWRQATQLVRGGTRRSDQDETSEALYLTSGFAYDAAEVAEARFKGEAAGFTYSRLSNPTVAMFEERMALIEGAEAARATASGMAAMTAALLSCLRAGDHVVASRALFGSCRWLVENLLPRFGVATTLVHGPDLEAWAKAVRPETKLFFFETPANPTFDLVDIQAVSKIAHDAGARVIVDNVFATPLYQKPLALGADIVAYSATKHIDGQGRVLGGVILGAQAYINDELLPLLRNTGPAMSPFNAWVLLKGLETLELRVDRMAANAQAVAGFIEARLGRVLYPGAKDHPQYDLAQRQMGNAGTIMSFFLADKAQAFAVMNAVELIDISNNIGDSRSLITHPASTTHQSLAEDARAELGITPGMVRLSVGLEDPQDVIEDLDQALAKVGL
ncbi:MAG: O-succinylhomoserine sulfhydrylase [Sphingomonadales bacterium]